MSAHVLKPTGLKAADAIRTYSRRKLKEFHLIHWLDYAREIEILGLGLLQDLGYHVRVPGSR